MYISYSGYKLFLDCPRAYYHRYIAKTVQLKPNNRVHMLYGDTVGKIFEKFYEDQVWAGPTPTKKLLSMVRPMLTKVMVHETSRGGVLDWNEPGLKEGTRSVEEIEKEILDAIPRGVLSIKRNRLVSRESFAEMKLDMAVGPYKIAGRADFIVRRVPPHQDLVIVDGKGSRHRGKYVSERQLRWYAMLYWLKFGVIPDRLGFLYWRYEPEESMDWFEVTKRQLEELQNSVLTTLDNIEKAKSELVQIRDKGKPVDLFMVSTGFQCTLCDYLPVCEEGKRSLSKDAKAQMVEDRNRGVEDGEVSF